MTCPQCGASVPDIDGPRHAYFGASPGCWEAYGRVLAREYSNPLFFANHGQTVDAYALQHPGDGSPQAHSSVMIHLFGATLTFKHDVSPKHRLNLIQVLSRRTKEDPSLIPHLPPPCDLGAVKVTDIEPLTDLKAHLDGVEGWARSAWEAWSDHHGAAERLIHLVQS